MSGAHVHLILNHFPLAALLFAIPFLIYGLARKSEQWSRAGMTLVVLAGLITVPVFLSGEPAEEIVEDVPGISEKVIHEHEEAGEKAIWVVGVAALGSLAFLVMARKNKPLHKAALPVVLALTLIALAAIAQTNNLGGLINHPELSPGAAAKSQSESKSEYEPESD